MKIRRIKARVKTPEIKPCPFCGGKATLSVDPEGIKDTQGRFWAYQITCTSCCATTGLHYSANKAVKWWNTRHLEEAQWIKTYPDNALDGDYYCSKCGGGIDIATGEETPLERDMYHCPNCGRKMYVFERG